MRKISKLVLGSLCILSFDAFSNPSPNKALEFEKIDFSYIKKEDFDKYKYNPYEYWLAGTDIVNEFSIDHAQAFYEGLYDIITKNFPKNLSYDEITNKIFESIDSMSGKISITTTDKRILFHDKDLNMIGNFKKPEENNATAWVNLVINTFLNLREKNKEFGSAHPEQIYHRTATYLIKSLDEDAKYTDPISAKEIKDNKNTTTLGFTYRKTPYGIQVWTITKDSPSYFSDIKAGDLITDINGMNITKLTDEQIEYLLTGDDTEIVQLNFVPYISRTPSQTFIRKNKVIIPSITTKLLNEKYPLITIHNFKSGTAKELQNVTQSVLSENDADGIILDLRGNIDGNEIEAIEAANLFIDGDILLKTDGKNDDQDQTYTAKSGDITNETPIILIVDNTTKGVSELFASIFEGRKRAVIIGTPSFGKTQISDTFELSNGGNIKFATKNIIKADGKRLTKLGIIPLICTSTILDDIDIRTLITNINNDKFKDNRPQTNNFSSELLETVRKSCPAIYPTKDAHTLLLKTATQILDTDDTYENLLK